MEREGRLRAEYQLWFPNLCRPSGTQRLTLPGLSSSSYSRASLGGHLEDRVPSDVHFVFRGGSGRRSTPGHSRRTDRPNYPA